MGQIKSDLRKFEVWDGGHCYIRLHTRPGYDTVGVDRMSPGVRLEELSAALAWATNLSFQAASFFEDKEDAISLAIDNDKGLLRHALNLARTYQDREQLSYFLFCMAMNQRELKNLIPNPMNPEYWKWLADQYIQKVQEGVEV